LNSHRYTRIRPLYENCIRSALFSA